jgi:predicted transcriptional regulator of viral defense system
MNAPLISPDRDQLFAIASAQEGLFTTEQAAAAGYSLPLLAHHLAGNTIRRIRRGIYRLVHFPAGEHEDLVIAWLWSEQCAVISHHSALSRHGLSDALPALLHLTLPSTWRKRRLRVPEGLVLHYADLANSEQTWFGPVPITSVARTLVDCAEIGLAPELLHQATQQALRRGLVRADQLHAVAAALAPFGAPFDDAIGETRP